MITVAAINSKVKERPPNGKDGHRVLIHPVTDATTTHLQGNIVMTTQVVSATEIATVPYSAERFAKMDRADRITRILYAARRRGESMTTAQAIDIIDAEIDTANAKQVTAELQTAEVVKVATETQQQPTIPTTTTAPSPRLWLSHAIRSTHSLLMADSSALNSSSVQPVKLARCRLAQVLPNTSKVAPSVLTMRVRTC